MVDDTAKLPNDLETPVAPPSGVIASGVGAPPPTPPPTPAVEPESPEPVKPKSNFKKNLPKIAGGLLVMALLLGGVLTGRNLLQQRAQVEQQATCKEGSVTNKGKTRETCVDGKKVETKIPDSEWSKLKDTEKKTGANLLKDVTFDSKEQLDTTVKQLLNPGSVQVTVDSGQGLPTCSGSPTASECVVGCGTIVTETGNTTTTGCTFDVFTGTLYYCPNLFEGQNGCNGTAILSAEDFASGNFCGIVQIDGGGGKLYSKRSTKGCNEKEKQVAERQITSRPNPSPTPGVSPSPTPTPSPSLSCVDLSGSGTGPTLGDTITLTCEASFDSLSPVAFFRYNVDGGTYTTSNAVTLDPTTKKATYDLTVDKVGSWNAQCRVCTNSSATSCTTWGQAN